MAVKIRLKRMGKIRAPYYRVVVADSRTKRDGRAIEEIGVYHPTHEPSTIVVDSERAQYWLGVGAQPTEQVMVLLKVTGDWQKFKGLPGAEGTLRFAAPKVDKKAVFEAAAKESMAASSEATTPKARKKAAPKAEAAAEPTQPTPPAEPTETAAPAEPVAEPVAEAAGADSDEVVADAAPAAEADKAAAEA